MLVSIKNTVLWYSSICKLYHKEYEEWCAQKSNTIGKQTLFLKIWESQMWMTYTAPNNFQSEQCFAEIEWFILVWERVWERMFLLGKTRKD